MPVMIPVSLSNSPPSDMLNISPIVILFTEITDGSNFILPTTPLIGSAGSTQIWIWNVSFFETDWYNGLIRTIVSSMSSSTTTTIPSSTMIGVRLSSEFDAVTLNRFNGLVPPFSAVKSTVASIPDVFVVLPPIITPKIPIIVPASLSIIPPSDMLNISPIVIPSTLTTSGSNSKLHTTPSIGSAGSTPIWIWNISSFETDWYIGLIRTIVSSDTGSEFGIRIMSCDVVNNIKTNIYGILEHVFLINFCFIIFHLSQVSLNFLKIHPLITPLFNFW